MSAPALFGVILPSRPVQTTPVVVSPTQFAFTFSSNPSYNHIIVFLLPGITLPDSTLAAIYAQLPGSAPEFKLLGALSNEKQSAIFRVSSASANPESTINGAIENEEDDMIDVDALPTTHDPLGDTTIGISIEPAATLLPHLATLTTSPTQSTTTLSSALIPSLARPSSQPPPPPPPPPPPTTKILAQRIIKNAFNFLASFAGTTAGEEFVPLRSFQDWWAKFERKIDHDPGFLERDGDE